MKTARFGDGGTTSSWGSWAIIDGKVMLENVWRKILIEKVHVTFEARLKYLWKAPDNTEIQAWISISACPNVFEDGSIQAVKEDLLVEKRQQESFIDKTSHEMRNPLSAVIQCADSILTSLTDITWINGQEIATQSTVRDLVDHCVEAARTITMCALHQKRIVDDILIMSKLDSKLLQITPTSVHPNKIFQNARKMFEGECQRTGIQLQFINTASMSKLHVDWLMLDPSRILQILINLLTNAIKFTRTATPVRAITVQMNASLERPSDILSNMNYFPSRIPMKDLTLQPEWGEGETIYLGFEIQDSGRGLSAEDKKRLFKRFSQSSAHPHIRYGGSGLGLFVSRELTEMQGGQIGVLPEAGVGSTFAVYIKTRRSLTANCFPLRSVGATDTAAKDYHNHFNIGELSILIVEDNLVIQKVLQRQLKALGCPVYLANNGEEALAFLERTKPWVGKDATGLPLSIILMDIEMPVMDSLVCTRKIRELQASGSLQAHIPIIAVTANAKIEGTPVFELSGIVSAKGVTKYGEKVNETIGFDYLQTIPHARFDSSNSELLQIFQYHMIKSSYAQELAFENLSLDDLADLRLSYGAKYPKIAVVQHRARFLCSDNTIREGWHCGRSFISRTSQIRYQEVYLESDIVRYLERFGKY